MIGSLPPMLPPGNRAYRVEAGACPLVPGRNAFWRLLCRLPSRVTFRYCDLRGAKASSLIIVPMHMCWKHNTHLLFVSVAFLMFCLPAFAQNLSAAPDRFPLLNEEVDVLCRRFLQVEIQRGLLMAHRVLFAPQLQQQTRSCGENRFGPVHLGMTARAERDHQLPRPTSPAPGDARSSRACVHQEHRSPQNGGMRWV